VKTIRYLPCIVLLLSSLACGGSPADEGGAGVTITMPSDHRLGGTATGIPAAGLSLVDAGAGQVTISQDGPFWFGTRLSMGAPYAVSLGGLVPGKYCSLANAVGVMPPAEVATITVTCQAVGTTSTP